MELFDYTPVKGANFSFNWEPLKIMPLGDIQYGSSSCDVDLLKENIDSAMKQGAYFIGMGDYVDVASPSNRKAWAVMSKYDSFEKAVEEKMAALEDEIYNLLKPTQGRWLGMLTGHHVWQYKNGTNSDVNLCKRLGTVHLGDCAMVRLQFAKDAHDTQSCVIWAHHGTGAGSSISFPITKLEKVVEWVEADIYLMGHQHKKVEAPLTRFYMSNGNPPFLMAKEKRLVGTGSYLKGYMQGSNEHGIAGGTYVEKSMLTPVALGSPMITVTPRKYERHGHTIRDLKMEVLV